LASASSTLSCSNETLNSWRQNGWNLTAVAIECHASWRRNTLVVHLNLEIIMKKQAVTASKDAKMTEQSTFNFGGIHEDQVVSHGNGIAWCGAAST